MPMVALLFYIYILQIQLFFRFFSKFVLVSDGGKVCIFRGKRSEKGRNTGNLSTSRTSAQVPLFGLRFYYQLIKEETPLLLEKRYRVPGAPETGGHSDREECSREQDR